MKDRSGEKYNMLTIVSFSHRKGNGYYWLCQCDCGNTKVVQYSNLQSNNVKSCGCHSRLFRTTHGLRRSRLYVIYHGMIQRCHDEKTKNYQAYGAKGITVCEEWRNSPDAFFKWCLASGYADHLQLDREKNSQGYSPENCRFVTRKVNCRNRNSNRLIEYKGEIKPLIEWCDRLNLSYGLMLGRIREGWSVDQAFETPVRKHKEYKNKTLAK